MKENAELDCQMNRNKFCYSCANATDRCFRNEIGCPCEKYKSYKDENAELKDKLEKLKEDIAEHDKQLTKAKEDCKTAYIKGMRHLAKALKYYDRTEGACTDYFEHTVDKVLKRELSGVEK